ncbi:DUF4190 domain-containing protein [Mycolicibacterium parafortuitum]|uniref:DUF4190 domain-containing protein n=1 Tax=Mycolicibacterium parafortuitum TaxID=39692 RepID=A0A375YLB4_MYCPF|nr:DUF4190 domain-containing protein [Mycolicibacterium parafortuitum]ORB30374.1 DUF4190 domain-containing protein [Mycolicibacterium parafortuitum]SRX81947.1 hypothetical protein MPP7335_03703 [Mycolicibacterium parafortuitum]
MSEPPPPPPGTYPGGYSPQPYGGYGGYPPPYPAPPKNGLGTASLVVAIISLFTVFGGVVLGVVAVILGFLGRGRVQRGEANNGGIAIAGIVLGAVSIVVSIVAIVIMAVVGWSVFKDVGGTDYIDCLNRAGSDQTAVEQCADEFTQRVEDEFSVTVTPRP